GQPRWSPIVGPQGIHLGGPRGPPSGLGPRKHGHGGHSAGGHVRPDGTVQGRGGGTPGPQLEGHVSAAQLEPRAGATGQQQQQRGRRPDEPPLAPEPQHHDQARGPHATDAARESARMRDSVRDHVLIWSTDGDARRGTHSYGPLE
ncbi:hypothetical protein HPB47_004195, partial [Ixodes persulcatus]